MNQEQGNADVSYTHEELLTGDLFNRLSKGDKKLLTSVIKPSKYMGDDMLPAFYSYILAYKVPNETELFLKMPEELMKLIDLDYTDLAKDFKNELGDQTDLTIVQVGCGRADLLVRLAKLGFTKLVGIECNPLQYQGALKKIEEFGVSDRVTVVQEFVQDYDYSKIGSKIDVVIIHNFWGVLDPPTTYKMIEQLEKCLTKEARIYLGPVRIPKKSSRWSTLKRTWKIIRFYRRNQKVKRKFGIQILFQIPFSFAEHGFTHDCLHFENAGHHYNRQWRKPVKDQ